MVDAATDGCFTGGTLGQPLEITSAPREESTGGAATIAGTLASVRWEVAGGDDWAGEARGRSCCSSDLAGGVIEPSTAARASYRFPRGRAGMTALVCLLLRSGTVTSVQGGGPGVEETGARMPDGSQRTVSWRAALRVEICFD